MYICMDCEIQFSQGVVGRFNINKFRPYCQEDYLFGRYFYCVNTVYRLLNLRCMYIGTCTYIGMYLIQNRRYGWNSEKARPI
jgi:hypothetical protein